jgi:CRP/FNR family cyclic AMP-dependent transcriptional regulator
VGKASTDFLGQLASDEREALLRLAKRRCVRTGQFIFRVGELKRGAYIVLRGRLKFFRLSPAGREVILWFSFPGEIFGLAEVPAVKGRRVNVQACDDSEVAVLPDGAFNRYLDDHPDAARLCRRTMTARLGILTNTLVSLAADDASIRIAKLVLHLGLHHGTRRGGEIELEVPLTHQEIGNMAGTNRQTVTRVLGRMKNKGILSIARRHIRIDSEEKLNRLIRDEAV